jgi:uncharacterized protein (DUF305 family)
MKETAMKTMIGTAPRVLPPKPPRATEASMRLYRFLSCVLVVGAVSLSTVRAISPARAAAAPNLTEEQPFIDENHAAMAKMMAAMAIKPTGDIDRDFVAMMVPHHQGAIDMARAELRHGHNQQLLRMSQEIVVKQLQEIAAMRIAVGDRVSSHEAKLAAGETAGTARSPRPPATAGTLPIAAEGPFLKENDTVMTKMMNDMTIKPTGEIDRDFVAMMVPHHQGAIDMARAELRYGRNARLRRIAQEIVVGQTQEIALMRLAVGEAPPSSTASPSRAPAPRVQMVPRPAPQMSMPMTPGQATTR